MKAKKIEIKKRKNLDRNTKNKNISINKTNKSKSLNSGNIKRKAKSKNKIINIKGTSFIKNSKINNSIKEIMYCKNNSINNNSHYHYLNNNENIYENISNYNNNIFNNTYSYGLSARNKNNNLENRASLNLLEMSLDRLLNNTHNILDKQNKILSDCELFTTNIAKSYYEIQNLNNNESNYLLEKYNISEKILNMKNNNNMHKLINENNSLKHKLEMMNINNENNIQFNYLYELDSLKKVLVNEINNLLVYFNEIGYNNIAINKIDIANLTSQKITYFFQIIKSIIKEMQELLHNKEIKISKMKIEKNFNKNKNEFNIDDINKSCENLSLNYDNIGFKNYNFSVRDSIHNKINDISFRNYQKNNEEDNIISKTQRSLNVDKEHETHKQNYFSNKVENNGIYKYVKDNELYIYNKIKNNINKKPIINYKTGNLNYQYMSDYRNKEIK